MQEIDVIDLKNRIEQGETIHLIDVREVFEHNDFNIGGKLIPLGDIMKDVEPFLQADPVVVYCRKGIRSMIAIQRLESKFGELSIYNLKGGIEAWKKMVNLDD